MRKIAEAPVVWEEEREGAAHSYAFGEKDEIFLTPKEAATYLH